MPKVLYLLFAMLLITSCGSDDDTDVFVPLEIQTQEDFDKYQHCKQLALTFSLTIQIFQQPGC